MTIRGQSQPLRQSESLQLAGRPLRDARRRPCALPENWLTYIDANREFFEPAVTGWGAPGGYGPDHVTAQDHALVATKPAD